MKNKKGSLSPYTHIKKAERLEIAILLEKRYRLKDIAKVLNRNISTISREVNHNSVSGVYNPHKANHKAYVKRKYSRFQMMKIVTNQSLWNYIEEKLKEGWSPEIIAGRIKNIDRYIKSISSKSIYKFIKNRYLERYLRLKGRKRRNSRRKVKQLADRTFIDQRPKSIDNRRYYGHWEGDFIVSGKNGSGALLVLYERKSRYVIIEKISKRNTETINRKIKKMLSNVRCLSLTLDNDISFQKHIKLSKMIKAPIYFCNPYHSWEKGGVENVNSLIRIYILKGTNISKISEEYIENVQRWINDKPRECLNYKTPFEVMAENGLFEDED